MWAQPTLETPQPKNAALTFLAPLTMSPSINPNPSISPPMPMFFPKLLSVETNPISTGMVTGSTRFVLVLVCNQASVARFA